TRRSALPGLWEALTSGDGRSPRPTESKPASHGPGCIRQPDRNGLVGGAGDGHKSAHGREPVGEVRSMLRCAVENRIGEAFELELVVMGIFAQRPVVSAVFFREASHHAALVEPWQVTPPLHAALLAVNLESFLEITTDRDREIEMSKRSAGELDLDKP